MPTWLTDVISSPFFPEMEYVLRVLVAVLLGGLIGIERELRDKPAGFRTIILITLGACVFTIVSQVIGGPDMDNTRIAAQVVTGIGFLGAGAILRDRHTVYGVTTAATIWAVAAMGMAVGFGMFGLALLVAVVILLALFLFEYIEDWIGHRRDVQDYTVVAPNAEGVLERLITLFTEAKLSPKQRAFYEEGDSVVFHITAMGAKSSHEKLRITLARSQEYQLRRK